MADKVRLPKPVSSATDEELQAYIGAHYEGGDKTELAKEVLRLRALVVTVGEDSNKSAEDLAPLIYTEKVEKRDKAAKKAAKAAEEDPLI